VLRIVGLLSLGLLLAAAAPAPSHVEEISLDYSTVGDCPSMREFEEQVYARTQRVRFVSGHRSKRYFRVHLGTDSGVAVGRVTSGSGSDGGNAREVTSDSCGDVAAAIALVVALAVDPNASVGAVQESATSPAQTAAPAVDAQPAAPTVDAQGAAPAKDAQPATSATYAPPAAPTAYVQTVPVPPRPASTTPANARPSHGALEPGTDGGEVTSVHPEASSPIALNIGARLNGALWWMPALVSFGAVALSLEGESTRNTPLAPAFRLSVGYASSGHASTTAGAQAHFDIASIQGEYCPARFAISTDVNMRPCVGFTGGRLTGTGVGAGAIVQSWSKDRPWGAIDESVHLQFALGKGWQTSIEAGLSEPLWGDKFVFRLSGQNDVTIGTTPRLVPLLGLGVSLRFF